MTKIFCRRCGALLFDQAKIEVVRTMKIRCLSYTQQNGHFVICNISRTVYPLPKASKQAALIASEVLLS